MIPITADRLVEAKWIPRSSHEVLPKAGDAEWLTFYIIKPDASIEVLLSRRGNSWQLAMEWWPRNRSIWPTGLKSMEQLQVLMSALSGD